MSIWIFTDRLRTPFTTQTTHSNLLWHLVTVLASLSCLGSPNESTRSFNLQLLNGILITSLQRFVCRTLKSRVYVFELKHPTGTPLFPVCFISSSVNCRMVFQRPGKWDRHVNVMKQWRLYCRLVWEWVERWGYVFSMADCRNGFNDNNSSEHNSEKLRGASNRGFSSVISRMTGR